MPGPDAPSLTNDEWMARLGALPLIYQPGERWLYHTGSDVLGVLIARVTGAPLGDFLRERLFDPLGMVDTGFYVPEPSLDRLPTAYVRDKDTDGLKVYDKARGGGFSRPPSFQAGGGGLVSTADDYLAFARMMLAKGRAGDERILARPTVEVMTSDQLTAEQKALSPFYPGFWDTAGWGFGLSVATRRRGIGLTPGAFGWDGGFGTSWRSDPAEDLSVIVLTQRLMGGPGDVRINRDVYTLAYQAIDD
jgi:CubicO group peptidase (beta-lactamase class C family)